MANPYQSPSSVQPQNPGLFSGLFNFFKGGLAGSQQTPQVNPAPVTPNFSPVPANFAPNSLVPSQGTMQNQNVGQSTSLPKQTNLGVNRGQLGQSQQFTTPSGAVVTQGGQLASAPQGLSQNNQVQSAPSIFDSLNNITPDQMTKFRTLFGLAPNTQQQQALGQLNALYEQAKTVNAPNPILTNLDQQIKQLQLQQANLNPTQLLKDNPSLVQGGITERQLEREAAAQGLPIAQSLSNLLVGRSALANTIGIQQQALGTQIENTQRQYGLIPSTGLPAEVGTKFLENQLVPKITPNFETILNAQGQPERVNIPTNQFGQALKGQEQVIGKTYVAPNMFNFLQQNPAANAALQNAVIEGKINPGAVNSRNAVFLASLYEKAPNFNSVQANAAAKFWESTGTQEKLAWSSSVNKNLDLLEGLSAKVSRTDLPLINSALLKGETLSGNTAAAQFTQAAGRTAAELSRVLGDSGGSDFRTKLAAGVLDPSFSPAQFKGVIGTERQMLSSLKSSFQEQGGQPQTIQGNQTNDPLGIR